jgi:DNA-binding MarR family transcriptional regulator
MTLAHDSSDYPLGPALEFLQRVWQLNHALERVSASMVRRLGITAQQRLIVRCLGKYPGMRAGQLASLLHVDPGTVSAALRRLEAKKLVARRRDPRDQRRASLGLSAAGRDLDRRVPGTVEHAVERLLDRADPDDIAAAIRVLEQLTALLDTELES